MRKRAELLAHIQNTNTQYNLPAIPDRLEYAGHREGLLDHFADDASIQMTVAADLALLDSYDETIHELELFLVEQTKENHGPG